MNATALSLCALLLVACKSGPPSAPQAGAAPSGSRELVGVLAPLGGKALALWPEAYAGGWLVLEVLPQGTAVKEGDVIARFDARAIDEELHRGELELQSSQLTHRALLEKNQLEAAGARAALARSAAALERAKRALASYETEERAFEERGDDLTRRYQEANVEDQTDELDQLQKMYQSDELVDATEDIVLKRSQRGLALTKDQNVLAQDRVTHRRALDRVLETERREEDLRAQEEAHARLAAQQAIEARARADAELRSADALAEQGEKLARLRRDRSLFELRATSGGLVLHGGVRDYRPGRSPARHERGSQLAPRSELFVVAPSDPTGVAFDVQDSERARFASGTSLTVRTFAGSAPVAAQVALDEYPRTLGTGETTLEATATLAAPLTGAHYGERVRILSGGE